MESILERTTRSLAIKTDWRCHLYQLHFTTPSSHYDFLTSDYLPAQLQKFWQAEGLIDLKIMANDNNREILITWTWRSKEEFEFAYHSSVWRHFQENIITWSDQGSIKNLSQLQNTFTIIE
ncbi:hypothetical protein [Roseivirga sp. 4D4]|uniref:hypothetical protein n=1 Tax=Roseivirga sp. 4D4 TaxID=1889784 RepID=UPI001112E73E|nr:hypothetical protein [Roseivirga sp. 4D4]